MGYIKVRTPKIPTIWDNIKYVVGKVYRITREQAGGIFIKVLHELLNDRYQCFVHLDDDGEKLKAMVFTEICVNKISGKKTLGIPCLYSFTYHTMEEWREFFQLIVDFAEQENAFPINCESSNGRVWEIVEHLGFAETSRNFTYNKET